MKNKLAIGTAQFGLDYGVNNGKKIAFKEVEKILSTALNNDIITLDTAYNYGECHKILGQAGVINNKIITKLPEIKLSKDIKTEKFIYNAVLESLKDLKLNKINGLLLHNPSQLNSNIGKEIYNTLCKLKSESLIDKIGISIYNPNELEEYVSKYNFDIIQSPLNIIDQRLINSGWLKKLKEMNIEVHVRSIFLQGLLLISKGNRPFKFSKWNKFWNEWDSQMVKVNNSALEVCLQFIYSIKEIDNILIGIDSYDQFLEIINIKYNSKFKFPELSEIENSENLINPSLWKNL